MTGVTAEALNRALANVIDAAQESLGLGGSGRVIIKGIVAEHFKPVIDSITETAWQDSEALKAQLALQKEELSKLTAAHALLKEPLFSGAKPAQSKAKTRGETRGKGGAAQTTRILRQAVGYWLWPAAS